MKTTVKKTETNEEIEAILNSKNIFNEDNLLNLDLENLDLNNLEKIVGEISKNVKQKKENKKDSLYKNNPDKGQRQKLRHKRNYYVDNMIFHFNNKNVNEVKNCFNEFKKFYLENYILNDFSESSIMQNNSDNETKIKVRLFLAICKKQLTKKETVKKVSTKKTETNENND